MPRLPWSSCHLGGPADRAGVLLRCVEHKTRNSLQLAHAAVPHDMSVPDSCPRRPLPPCARTLQLLPELPNAPHPSPSCPRCPQAALCEYKSAAVAVGLQLPAYLQSLSVETLLQQQQEDQVVQLLYSQAEHVADDVVQRLLALAPPPLLAPSSETSPLAVCRQMGVDALARRALGCRYEPVGGGGGSAAAAAAGSRRPAPVVAPPQGDAGEYVAALMQAGEWLRAARVMRRYRVLKPSVRDFLAAVGAAGDEVVFSSCYRLFKDEVLSTYPKYELAARKLLAAGGQQQQTAAA